MTTTRFSNITDKIATNYGDAIIKAFTDYGPGGEMVPARSIVGALQQLGRVFIGGGGDSDRYADDWGVHATQQSSTAYGAGEAYAANTPATFDAAYIDWKRRHIPLSWDDLERASGGRSQVRGGNPVNFDLRANLARLMTDICNDGIGDGTGTSSKVFTGARAWLSAANTYAAIDQAANSYWQAQVDSSGGALTKDHIESMMETLDGVDGTKPGLEIWMPLNQYNRHKNLFVDSLRYGATDKTSEGMTQVYDNGAFQVPIRVIRNITTTEVWFCNTADLALRFCDQAMGDDLSDLGNSQLSVYEGLPIGFKHIAENSDTSTIILRVWGNFVCRNPRHQGVLTGLSA